MTVGLLQHGLGDIPQEMVVAVAIRHIRKFRRDSRHRGVLLVRHPKHDQFAQGFGPLPGLGDLIDRWTSSAVAESKASANQTRFWVSSLAT
jgi:hypothetical protein